jgi:hypothetical protein
VAVKQPARSPGTPRSSACESRRSPGPCWKGTNREPCSDSNDRSRRESRAVTATSEPTAALVASSSWIRDSRTGLECRARWQE